MHERQLRRTGAFLIIGAVFLASETAAQRPASHSTSAADSAVLARAFRRGSEIAPLNSLIIARDGRILGERYYRGMTANRAVNIKSASKSVLSALIGIAIAQNRLRLDQPVAQLLPQYFPREEDPRKRTITVRNLLTMQAGLESTSFDSYGAWVNSRDWVRDAVRRPIVCEPGTCMLYSTGNSHLLSVILTRATGIDTRTFANRHLFAPLETSIRPWTRDPQGFYLGGNEMHLTPRQLLGFGQLYLDRGVVNGKRILSEDWIRASWGEYATSPWNGHRYGYHWWTRTSGAHHVHFAWGYGGQFVFVVPSLRLVVVATSALQSRRSGPHLDHVHRLLDDIVGGLSST